MPIDVRSTNIVESYAPSKYWDQDAWFMGTDLDVANCYDIADANANLWKTDLLAGGAVHVPVHVYGVDIAGRDLGFFNGQTQPAVALVDVDRDSWIKISFRADDEPEISVGGSASMLYLPNITATEVTIYSAENLFYLTESDQTDPAGRYRFRLQGDILFLEDATTASWAADNDLQTWAAGEVIINESGADVNFRVEGDTNANMIVVDAGLDTMALGAAVQADTRLYIGFGTLTVTADANGEFVDINPALTEAGSGTHAVMAGLNIQALTLTAGVGATTAAATVRIAGAPSGATSNYAFWVVAGTSQFDGAAVFASTVSLLGAVTVADDVLFSLGTNNDQVFLNRSTTLAADTTLANVLEGTVESQAIAANSLMISNITDDGDIAMYVSKAGSSQMVFWADGSTGDTVILAASGQSVDIYIAGTKEYDFSATSADFNANTIDDVGTISVTDAAGPSVANEAATNTNPTLIPNRAEMDTGIGWASDVIYIVLGGAEEYGFSTTSFDLNSNTVDEAGTISVTNAAGPSILNEAATTTNPTLVPNRAELDTGIGWASDVIHVVLGGASEYSFSTTILEMNENHIDNCGYIVLNATTWVTGETGIWNESTGELHLNAVTGKTVVIEIADTAEYTFSATTLDMSNNAIDNCGYIILNVATSPAATEAHLTNIAGNVMLNATTGNQINLAVANTSVMRVFSDRVFFFQDIFTDRWQWMPTNTLIGSGIANGGGLTAAATHNTGYGYVAFTGITSASFTTAVGSRVLVSLTSGDANTAIGYYALRLVTTGAGNTALGHQAGDNITTGSYNMVIGYDVDAPSATANYQIEIGDGVNQGRLRSDNAGDWTIYSPSGKVIKFQPDGDTGDYVTLDTVSDVPTWYATGSYMRFGDAATTQISLASEDDVMISGILEVYGITYHTGVVFVGGADVTADAVLGPTVGIHINQAANDDAILIAQSSDVAHGMTTVADTATYLAILKEVALGGGVRVEAISDANHGTLPTLDFHVHSGTAADTTKSSSGRAIVEVYASLISGTGEAAVTADGNIFAIRGNTVNTVAIVDEDGDLWLNGGLTLGGTTPNAIYQIYTGKVVTITDNNLQAVLRSDTAYAKTSAAYTSIAYVLSAMSTLDSTNTQNWTYATPASLVGIATGIVTEAGSSGTVTAAAGLVITGTIANAATVTTLYMEYIGTPTVAGSKVTNLYGIYIADQNTGATLNYGIYIVGASTAAVYVASADPIHMGLAGSGTGKMEIAGTTSGVVTVTVADAAGTWTMTLPTAVGAAGDQLTDAAGNGVCSWTAAASLREMKENIEVFASPRDALDLILNTRVYQFNYREGMGTLDTDTRYVGVMSDEAPWAMHYGGRIVNPVNTLGYMVLGIQAINDKVESIADRVLRLEQELVEARAELAEIRRG